MRRDALTLVTGLLSGLAGCGYLTQRPFPTDIRTIHVEMFHSKEFRRELEFRLTEALIKRIEMDTPYRIAPKRTADAVLSGDMMRYFEGVLERDDGRILFLSVPALFDSPHLEPYRSHDG